jgi:hypothetical protein
MDAKDYVAIVTGLIGCATGATALVRGWMLDRKLHWEPYFEKKWNGIGAPIRNNLEQIRHWLDMLERELSAEDPNELSVSPSVPPPVGHIDWSYDRRFHMKLDEYSAYLTACKARVKRYNLLLSLLDAKTYLDFSLKGTFIGSGQVDVSDSSRQAHEARRQETLDLIKYYHGSGDISLEELRGNKKLGADIEQSRSAIIRDISNLRELMAPIEAAVDFYDTRSVS